MLEHIPKRVLRRYLFQFKVPLTYRKTLQVIRAAVEDSDEGFKNVQAQDILSIKRALEAYRKNEGVSTQELIEGEISLLEKAAEMGDRAAIALLVGARLGEKNVSKDDWKSGSDLLKQLMDEKFPLSFKISGDLAYQMGKPEEARKFYELAVDSGLEDNRLRTECLRNIGHISFTQGNLFTARKYFSRACQEAEDLKQVADCHFYLAQLREADREAARRHLEVAAGGGLTDAFVPLGMLLLNYFGRPELARSWLQLGLVTDKTGMAALGLLDAAVRLNNNKLVKDTVARLQKMENGAMLLESRAHVLKQLESGTKAPEEPVKVTRTTIDPATGRWEF